MTARGLDRRQVLLGGAAAMSGAGLFARGAAAQSGAEPGAVRTLVLFQLTGGNDGLSTVVPWADDAYHAARPTIAVPTEDVLKLDDYRGLHPGLERLRAVYDRGSLAIVEGVGYPEPTRSHFSSMDIWHAADPRGRGVSEGWVGRLARTSFEDTDPNVVVHVGPNVPYSLHSTERPPASFLMPRSYRWAGDEAQTSAYERIADVEEAEEPPDSSLGYLRKVLADGQRSSARVRRAAASYATPVEYPSSSLGAALHSIAALVNGRIGTRVLSVECPGFDTHNGQNTRHGNLMRTLDAALGALLEDLERTEAGRETVVLVFSEFGRRVEENGTDGTDHGIAGPVLVAGPGVRGGQYGAHPSLTELDSGDLIHTTDFRSVYATVIERWFGVASAPVLGEEYLPLGFLA